MLNSNFHNLRDTTILNSLINVINNPTRQNAILDPILIPNDMEVSDSSIIIFPQEISDHCATYVPIPFSYEIQQSYERTIWLYKKANFEMLNQKIFNYDWNILLNVSVDEPCEIFTDTFIEIVKQRIPCKKVCVRPDDQPWYDTALRRLSCKRYRTKSLAKASGKPALWLKYKNIKHTK